MINQESNRRKVHNSLVLLGVASGPDLMNITGLPSVAIKDALHALRAKGCCVTIKRGGGAISSTYRAIQTPFSATKNMQPVLSFLHRADRPATTHEIASGCGLTTRHCRRPLELLKEAGFITGKSMRKTTEWARVPGMELPPLDLPTVSGKQSAKFLRSLQTPTPVWVPKSSMAEFLQSIVNRT